MNLRQARINDFWRRAFKRKFDVYIKSISLDGDHLFSDFVTRIDNGVVCIIGKNGIGKSNFIRTIYNAFQTEESNRELFKIPILSDGTITFQVQNHNEIKNYTTNVGLSIKENEGLITSFIFDPCNTIPTLQNLISSQSNFEELLEGFGVKEMTEDDIEVIQYLTKSIYKKVDLIIIEEELSGFSSLPFFKVIKDNVDYDVRTMGLGELSLFYFYWLIEHIRQHEGDKILLIEEPESFLPPSSQEKLADILAKFISETGVSCLISSHSEHILKRVPRENILIFRKEQNKIKCKQASDKHEFLNILGLTAPKIGLLLFEDSAAKLFFKALIKHSKEHVVDSFYFHISGSEGDIVNDLKRIPSEIESFRILGIFDGDCRNDQLGLGEKSIYTFLPSENSPEKLLIDFIRGVSQNDLSLLFNRTEEEIAHAIEDTYGSDQHDYFEILSKKLDIDYNFIMTSLFDKWINSHKNSQSVDEFIIDFGKKVK